MKFNGLFKTPRTAGLLILLVLLAAVIANQNELPTTRAQSHTPAQQIDEVDNVRTELRQAEEIGEVDETRLMDLSIGFEIQNRTDLDRLISELHNPASPMYQQWLTPEQFGDHFGAPAAEYERMAQWLEAQGFEITQRWANRLNLGFRGRKSQIRKSFKTNIKLFRQDGGIYFANDQHPEIPTEFAKSVKRVRGLENFSQVRPATEQLGIDSDQLQPQFRGGGLTALAPKDLQRVYNLENLLAAGINGQGQKIGIVARSNYHKKDVKTFRERLGLSTKLPKKVFPFGNVRNRGGGEEVEVLLDSQWAGAAAPMADIFVVIAPEVDMSLEYLVNKMPEVKSISISFGLCEKKLGESNTRFFHDLYTQAAAQGQTVFVSSGDFGANDCGDRQGQQVNGLASSPNCVAVGGTTLNAKYDGSGDAVSFTGESAWNGSGGGTSIIFEKPEYQQDTAGVSETNFRSLPDISQMADPGGPGAWIGRKGDLTCCIGGTSLAAPIWAGFLALVNQQAGPQGNLNYRLYQMGNAMQTGTMPEVFYDTIVGNNTLYGVTGFSAVKGYDRATGWGSFNGQLFIENIQKQ